MSDPSFYFDKLNKYRERALREIPPDMDRKEVFSTALTYEFWGKGYDRDLFWLLLQIHTLLESAPITVMFSIDYIHNSIEDIFAFQQAGREFIMGGDFNISHVTEGGTICSAPPY